MGLKSSTSEILSSYKTTIVLLLIYAFGLAIATFIEKYMGTEAAKTIVYYSPVFFLLQFLLVLNFVFALINHKLFKKSKWGFMLVHIAMIVILAGALTSHVFGKEGVIHLREGDKTDKMLIQTNRGDEYHELPFNLELIKFTLTRYPGSSSPSSFESALIVHTDGKSVEKKISMNNVLDIKGYRLFQASYDTDEKGTILSVNKDVAGRNVTYTGYILLIIGFILCFIGKDSRFRKLMYKLKELKKVSRPVIVLLLLMSPTFLFSVHAQDNESKGSMLDIILKKEINPEHAAMFGALPMQSIDGRMEPVNTFSSEVLRKLHHSDKIGNLNSDQFLLSVFTLPEMWTYVPFIIYSNKSIAFNFDITEGGCAYVELFDSNGNYKLQRDLEDAFKKSPSERTRFDKDLIKLDEQINIFHQLISHKMVNIFPDKEDYNNKWYAYGDDLSSFATEDSSFITQTINDYLKNILDGIRTNDWTKANNSLASIRVFQIEKASPSEITVKRLDAELMYNKLNIFRQCKKSYLILGGLMLVLSFVSLFRKQKWIIWSIRFLTILVFVSILYHLFGIGMRWYIAGYAPWSNSYETMVYVSFITVVAGLLFARQSHITLALATLFGGVILFVSGLNWMDPQISPLVPVLKSPWLMIHVAVIVAAYGFFGISFLLGTTNVFLLSFNKKKKYPVLTLRSQELTIVNEMSLWAGLALMTIGTFLGAVWANESWGRYWGWDPKETWALVTIVVYAIVTHLRLVKKWDRPFLFNLLSVLAFAAVLMTYFGVNYYLSGMHSYG